VVNKHDKRSIFVNKELRTAAFSVPVSFNSWVGS